MWRGDVRDEIEIEMQAAVLCIGLTRRRLGVNPRACPSDPQAEQQQ